jgi:hypothetical protein
MELLEFLNRWGLDRELRALRSDDNFKSEATVDHLLRVVYLLLKRCGRGVGGGPGPLEVVSA